MDGEKVEFMNSRGCDIGQRRKSQACSTARIKPVDNFFRLPVMASASGLLLYVMSDWLDVVSDNTWQTSGK